MRLDERCLIALVAPMLALIPSISRGMVNENSDEEKMRGLQSVFEQHQRNKLRSALEEHLRALKNLKNEPRKEPKDDQASSTSLLRRLLEARLLSHLRPRSAH